MTTYTLDGIRGLDLSITIEPSLQGYRGYGIAFDEDADIVEETDSRQYIGYCIPDVLASIAAELVAHVPHRNDDDVYDALHAHGMICNCD